MASSSKRILTIGREHWNQFDDDAGYLITDSDLTLCLLATLYNSASLNVNPHDSPTEVQRYNTQGYFTAMNTAMKATAIEPICWIAPIFYRNLLSN